MTYNQCLADAQDLKATMIKWGVACSIELVPGRGSDPWASIRKYLRMHHHVASYYKPGGNMTPMLYLVKQGRPDVVGPLANGYGGFDRVYRILCMGMANHSGLGGPITIDGVYVPKDSARGPTWGTEWEGGYQDWASIPGMLEFMGRADNALAEWSGRPITSQMEHKTWAPTRKVDRKDFTRASGIALTQQYHGSATQPPKPPQEEEDMKPALVQRPRDGGVFIWFPGDNSKSHQRNWDEIAQNLWNYAASGNPISTQANGQPHKWLDWQVDIMKPCVPGNDDFGDPIDLRNKRAHQIRSIRSETWMPHEISAAWTLWNAEQANVNTEAPPAAAVAATAEAEVTETRALTTDLTGMPDEPPDPEELAILGAALEKEKAAA